MGTKIDSLFVRLGLDMSDFQLGLSKAGKTLGAVGKQFTQLGRTLSLSVTAPIVAMGAASLLAFGNFEKGMNRVLALTGATESEFKTLTELAKELGRTTAFSASEAAAGMGFLAKSGFEAEQILSTMPKVLTLAASSQLELAEAADITTNILKGLKLPVEELSRAVDVLAKANTSTNVDVRQLGQSFKFVGPVAAKVGLQFEETAAILGTLGNAGIQAGMAGRNLRGIIAKLVNPSKEAQKALAELGVSTVDGAGKMLPFVDILEDFRAAGLSAAEAARIFGNENFTAALVMTDAAGEIRQLTALLGEAGGTAERIAEVQLRGLSGALVKMKSAMEGAAIAIGERLAPLMIKIAGIVTEVAAFISRLDRRWLILGVTLAGVAAVIGPLLIVLGGLATAISIIIPGLIAAAPFIVIVAAELSGLAVSAGAAAASVAALALPIAVGIAALLAIGIVVVQVIKNWAVFAGAGETLRNIIARIFASMSQVILGFPKDILSSFKATVGFLDPVADAIRLWANTAIDFWVQIAKGARKWLVNNFGAELNRMIRIVNVAGFLFDKNFSPIAEIATGVALEASEAVKAMNKDFGAGFKDMEVNVKSSMDGIREAVAFGVNDIKKNLGEVATDARGIFGGATAAVAEFFGIASADAVAATAEMKQAVQEMFDAINEKSKGSGETVKTTWQEMLEGMRVTLVDFQELILSVWDAFTTGLGDAFAAAIVDSESLAASFRSLAKTISKALISALIKLGVQHFVAGRAGASAAQIQGKQVVGSNLQAVFSATFASISAIPIVGPSLAPAAAAAALAAASAGTTAAGAIGSAIGARPMAAGGVVTRPLLAMVGEAGPEAVIPLSQFGGSKSQTIIVELDGEVLTRRVVEGLPDDLRVTTGLEF